MAVSIVLYVCHPARNELISFGEQFAKVTNALRVGVDHLDAGIVTAAVGALLVQQIWLRLAKDGLISLKRVVGKTRPQRLDGICDWVSRL